MAEKSPHPSLATAANVSAISGTQFKSLPQDTLLPVLADAMIFSRLKNGVDWGGRFVPRDYEETDAILDPQRRECAMGTNVTWTQNGHVCASVAVGCFCYRDNFSSSVL